jgi:hypothetical protein
MWWHRLGVRRPAADIGVDAEARGLTISLNSAGVVFMEGKRAGQVTLRGVR